MSEITRTLHLMRHAQAEAHGPRGDKSRPLSDRGRDEATRAGAVLRGAGIELALVSSAVRTRQTFEQLGLEVRVEFMDVLYRGGLDDLTQRIGEINDALTGLLVVGHSPTIPALAAELLHASAPAQADHLQCHYPTSTITTLRTTGPWAELGRHGVDLVRLGRG